MMTLLTPKQIEVARCVAQGMPNKQIAHRLGMSVGTVKAHLVQMFNKLGVRNRTGLAILLSRLTQQAAE